MIKKNKNKKGFTILELLITSAVLSIGVLAIASMIINSFSRTVLLSNNMTASYLAQEGFEVVRRIRDKNFNMAYADSVDRPDWDKGLLDGDTEATGSVYYDSTELGNNHNEYLKVDSSGLLSYSPGGTETTFKREILLEKKYFDFENGTGEYILVTVVVTWEEKGEETSSTRREAKTKLYNWY